MVFSDYEKSQYLKGLYQLARVEGSRIEQQLAAATARKLLTEYFPGNQLYFGMEEEQSVQRFQKPNGGIAILPYGESDPALSAVVASLESGDFDKRALAGYFYGILEGEKTGEDDRSLALWGLAALKEPVLIQLNEKLQEKDLAPGERIRLSMACADAGNGAVGLATFKELLAQYGEDLGTTMRIKVGKDQDEIIAATTQMALLAARLDRPEKAKLYQYILENKGTEILNNLEQVRILQYNLRYMDPAPVSFTYELNGQKVSKDLKGKDTFQLTLLPDDLEKIKFSQIKGRVGVLATYIRGFSASDITPQEGLTINRSYLAQGKQTNTFSRSDLVQVVLTYDIGDKAPAGRYEIVDILPAGLKYVNRPYLYEQKPARDLGYPSEVKGQKLTFPAYKGKGKLVYYARVASPGDFTAQTPLLSHMKSEQIAVLGSQERVLIK